MADTDPQAPDFAAGVPLDEIPAGGVLGVTLYGEPWLLARAAGEVVAIGGPCTYYSGPSPRACARAKRIVVVGAGAAGPSGGDDRTIAVDAM